MRIVGFLLVLALMVGCGPDAYQDISVAELQEMMAEGEFFFVNVHVPFEGVLSTTSIAPTESAILLILS